VCGLFECSSPVDPEPDVEFPLSECSGKSM
jgi:hypothetical protein